MAESQEHLLPHIPYPELYAPEAVHDQLTRDILLNPRPDAVASPEENIPNKPTVSPIDLRRIAAGMTDQEILDSVSNHLSVPFDAIDAVPTSAQGQEKLERQFADVNDALSDAHRYLKGELGLTVPTIEVHSKKDIVDLIRKTALYKESNKKGLEMHAGYCALVAVTLAVFELQKKEALTLEKEMDYVARFLTEVNDANGGEPLFFKHSTGDIGSMINVMVNGVSPTCRARLSMRDKTPESQTTKYLRKPEATAEAAQKDAIALRIEVENARMEDVLVRVLNYLQEQMVATNLLVEDKHLLDKDRGRLGDFKERKSKEVHNGDQIAAISDTSQLTADSYRGINVTCKVNIPRAGSSKEFVTRSIEFQLVEPLNKNESGLSSHPVYELKKKITVMTRLFGGCSHKWLMDRTKEIARTEGFSEEFVSNTIQGLQDVGFLVRLPNTPNKKVYAASEVYSRWLRVDGLIENDLIRDRMLHKLKSV